MGAFFHRLDRRLRCGIRRHHDELSLRLNLFGPLKHFDAIHPGHLQIAQNDLHRLRLQNCQPLFWLARGHDLVALFREHALQDSSHLGLIINNQNGGRHRFFCLLYSQAE